MPSSKRYPTDLTDTEFAILQPLLPPPARRGRNPTPWRTILNALFYWLRSGGAWRLLPKCFPPWQTVCEWLRRWRREGRWQKVPDALRAQLRQQPGKQRQPSAGILDSQSVKVAEQGGARGYDAGKIVQGRERHLLVGTLGLVLLVWVSAAHVQDRDAARTLLARLAQRFSRLVLIGADGGYTGKLVHWVWALWSRRKIRTTGSWWAQPLRPATRPANTHGVTLATRAWQFGHKIRWKLGRSRQNPTTRIRPEARPVRSA